MNDAKTPALFTQGWLHPARASAGETAFTAMSTSHAPAEEPAQRQRKTRVIAICHPTIDKLFFVNALSRKAEPVCPSSYQI
jgi:hypothetical protein